MSNNRDDADFEGDFEKYQECKKLKSEWLECKSTFGPFKYGFLGTRVCKNKYIKYMCKCFDEDKKKRFHCSIFGTH